MTSSLPLIGVHTVITGMAAWNNNAKSVNSTLVEMGRNAYYLERSTNRAMTGVEASFAGAFGSVLKIAGVVTGAIATLAAGAIVLGQRYGKDLAFIGAITESTSAQIAKLNDTQLEMARSSNVTTLELQRASGELLKAGQSIDQVTSSSLAAAQAMVIASNGELDLARAANIVQVSMAAFSDTNTTATQAANAATAAVQRGTLTFTGYADALKQGGPAFALMGYTIEQFAGAVGTASQQLISGTEIGTGLRVALQRLQDPTEENIALMGRFGISLYEAGTGKARPLYDVLVDLEQEFGDGAVKAGKYTAAVRDQALAQLFGARTGKVLAAILDEGTSKYLELLDAAGRTDVFRIANVIMADTANVLAALGNNAQVTGIAFNQGLDPYINNVAKSLLNMARSVPLQLFRNIGDLIGSTVYNAFANLGTLLDQVAIPAWRSLFDAVGRVIGVLGSIASAFGLTSNVFAEFASNMLKGWQLIGAISLTAFKLIVSGLNGLADMLAQNRDAIVEFISGVLLASQVLIDSLFNAIGGVITRIGEFIQSILTNQAFMESLRNAIIILGTTYVLLARVVGFVVESTVEALRQMHDRHMEVFRGVAEGLQTSANQFGQFADAVGGAVNAIVNAYLRSLFNALPLIAQAAVHLAQSWAANWGGIAGVVGTAIRVILRALNGMLEGLASLPFIGEHISSARAAVEGFIDGVATFAASTSDTVTGFVNGAIGAFNAVAANVRSVQLPAFQNFAGGVKDSFAAARAEYDALLNSLKRKPAIPDIETEPGSLPELKGGGAKDAADKAAKEIEDLIGRAKELIRDFNDDVDKQTRVTTNDIAKLYAVAATDIAESMQDAAKEINEATEDIQQQVAEMFSNRDLEADAKARTDALEDVLDEETRLHELALEDAEVLNQRELEDAKLKYDNILEAARKANDDLLDVAARARDITREDEDREFERKQREAERNQKRALDKILDGEQQILDEAQNLRDTALKEKQDAEERALGKILDAEEDALKKRLDLEKDALKTSQDQRETALQTQLDAEARTRDQARDLATITDEDATARAKAQGEYNTELAIGVKQSIAQARLDEKLRKIQEDTQEARAEFERRKGEGEADLAFEAQQEVKLQQLRVKFAEEEAALEIQQQAASFALSETHEQRKLDLKAEHEKQAVALRKKSEEEITDLHEDHEKRRDEITNTLEKDALDRRRTRAVQDREFAEGQAKKQRDFAEAQEKEALKESRRMQDEELKRRRGLDEKETAFKKSQEERRATLRKQLDDEDFNRKLINMQAEHDKRINQIEATLAEEQEKTRTKLAQDITDLNVNLKERIDTIREQYIDRLQDILEKGGDQLQPLVDRITGHIDTGLQGIRDSAQEVVDALKEVFTQTEAVTAAANALGAARSSASAPVANTGGGGGASGGDVLRQGGKPGETASEVENFLKNQAKAHEANLAAQGAALAGIGAAGAAATIAKALGFQYGGQVPGRFGEPMLAKVHGGEQYLGIGAAGTTLAAVEAAEAMAHRGTQGSTTVNYNYDWDVHANYGRAQAEGTIRQDISALVSLTRR